MPLFSSVSSPIAGPLLPETRSAYTTDSSSEEEDNSSIDDIVRKYQEYRIDPYDNEWYTEEEFYNYLDKEWKKRGKELENKFFYNKRQFWKDVSKTKWRDKWSVYFDRFDI